MAAQITLIDAAVKYTAGPPCDTQRGSRILVVCTLPDGTEQKLWGDPGDAALTSLKKGQTVKLAFDGRSYKLAADAPPGSFCPYPCLGARAGGVGRGKKGSCQPDSEVCEVDAVLVSSRLVSSAGNWCERKKFLRSALRSSRFAIAKILFELAV